MNSLISVTSAFNDQTRPADECFQCGVRSRIVCFIYSWSRRGRFPPHFHIYNGFIGEDEASSAVKGSLQPMGTQAKLHNFTQQYSKLIKLSV